MEELLGKFTFSDDSSSSIKEKQEKIVFVSDDGSETIFKFVEIETTDSIDEPVDSK